MYESKKKYFYGTGRRKSSVARVRVYENGTGSVIINTDKAILTGKKLDQKKYYRVTGWIGNMKETKARVMMDTRSDYAMELAVKGMLPKNTLGRTALTRLHLYKGAEHLHAAQKPEAWTLD